MSRSNFLVLFFITCLGSGGFGLASELYDKTYQFRKKWISFSYLPGKSVLISTSCIANEPNGKETQSLVCDAYLKPTRAPKTIWASLRFSEGMNPGALLCKKLTGSVQWGLDRNGNQVGFCEFKDHSLISLGSLVSLIR